MFRKQKEKEAQQLSLIEERLLQSKRMDEAKAIGHQLEDMAHELSSVSEEILSQTQQVSDKTTIVAENSVAQVQKNILCLSLTEELQQLLKELFTHQQHITDAIEKTRSSNEHSKEQMVALQTASEASLETTKRVVEDVLLLMEKMQEITSFTDTIQAIASQTNLLSLNASIEAARAGEAGKGFKVVAEEVKKLSDESSLAAKDINQTVKGITQQIEKTVSNIQSTNTYAQDQYESVLLTNDMIHTVDENTNAIEQAVLNSEELMVEIENKTEEINTHTFEVSSISESNAAEIHSVNESTTELTVAMKRVTKTSEHLMDMTSRMLNDLH